MEEGHHNEAVTLVIESYRAELLGYMINIARDVHFSEDEFQSVCIKIWRGLPTFQWKSTLRTWVYRIARNEFISHKRRVRSGQVERLQTQDLAQIPDRMLRTITREWQKTEARAWLWDRIRELPDDDQALLVLRLGSKMKWSEIVVVMLEEEDADEETRRRKVSSLRKRYERLKTKLRARVN